MPLGCPGSFVHGLPTAPQHAASGAVAANGAGYGACALVAELDRIARSEGYSRKVLVARNPGEGRELLAQVVLRGTSWAGFELRTLQTLAAEIVWIGGHLGGRTIADAFEIQALVERAIDEALADGQLLPYPEQVERVGLREAVRRSVAALRMGGVRAAALAGRGSSPTIAGAVLGRYEELLAWEGMADGASVLKAAAAAVRRGAASLPRARRILLLPGVHSRGLPGSFAQGLIDRGATLLAADPVEGLPAPEGIHWRSAGAKAAGSWLHRPGAYRGTTGPIELFAASSVADELRGVLRRAMAKGRRWDEVEIVATDPIVYGSALHAVAEAMGIPVTYATGLAVERTRPGRVAAAYFRWVESDFQEARIRALIEANDIRPPPPDDDISGARLARSLRRLRIGWGRDRYLRRIDNALAQLSAMRPRSDESEEELAGRRERRREELCALRSLLAPVLAATPAVEGRTSAAKVAIGVGALLRHLAPGTDTDDTARGRLARHLERIEATLHRVTDYTAAAATVQGFLRLSVPAPRDEGVAPWGSAPGHLYLTDLDHGGATGRPYTAIVGMDAGRLPGSSREDPLLPDGDRRRLGDEALPLAAQGAAERRFRFAQLVARLRGELSMSYTRWDPSQARHLAPAPEMLQALRLRERDPSLSFEELQRSLGVSESRLPRAETAADLDEADVWLRLLEAPDGTLLDGGAAVARAHPRLARSRAAHDARHRDVASVHTGFLAPPTPGEPFRDFSEWTFSATSLGNLGTCPRRFLLGSVLDASPPNDPVFDPDRWLNALQRGTLLHEVYERALAAVRERGVEVGDDAFLALALAQLDRTVAKAIRRVPTPSALVRELEIEGLRDDVRSFVEMVRSRPPAWTRLEMSFGGPEDPLTIDVAGTRARVRGAIDRIDEGEGGEVRVVDYKTGRSSGYDAAGAPFDGGRRLQGYLYVEAVRRELGRRADAMEYHFPTRRGENHVEAIAAHRLHGGAMLVATLLEGAREGRFPATDTPADCRYCDFGVVCGVRTDRWGKVSCRHADWTKRNLESLPELDSLRRVRNRP